MTDQLLGEAAWHEPEYYGLGAGALGVLIELSKDAPVRADKERRWYVSDHSALLAAMGFERALTERGFPSDTPVRVRVELEEYLNTWRGALPFSEVERGLVSRAYQQASEPLRYREVPGLLRRAEYEVVSGGIRSVVRGRDLMQRWWAWRRGVDQFAGQGGVAQAKAAIGSVAGRLIHPDEMPAIYYSLRGIPLPADYWTSRGWPSDSNDAPR